MPSGEALRRPLVRYFTPIALRERALRPFAPPNVRVRFFHRGRARRHILLRLTKCTGALLIRGNTPDHRLPQHNRPRVPKIVPTPLSPSSQLATQPCL